MGEIVIDQKIELKRSVSVFSGCAYILGTIIGSGIFISPKGVVVESGSVGSALLIWFLCGVLVLLGALSYAELGTAVPKTGGPYEYIRAAFGDFPAFLYCWAIVMIVLPTGNAVISLTFAYYVIQPAFPSCASPDTAVLLLAAVAVALLTFVNGFSTDLSARVQTIFTVVKIIALIAIIITGIYAISIGYTENFVKPFEGSTTTAGGISLAFYSGMFSYAGWDTLNFLTEELKNPYKNLPRCIMISIPLVTIIYTFANVAYFTVLSPIEVMNSEAVAVDFAAKIFNYLALAMPIFVAFSTFGSLNGCISCAGRVFYAGSRQGHMPDFISLININRFTPVNAVGALGTVTMMYLLVGDVLTLINYCAFVEVMSFTACAAALLWLRVKQPNLPRPIKVPIIFPILFFCVNTFLLVLGLVFSPKDTGMGLLLLLSGIPFYIFGVVWKKKPMFFRQKMRQLTEVAQKITIGVPQDS